MYAFSNTGTNGAFVQANLTANDPLGFGAISGSNETAWLDATHAPQHAFDNVTTGCGSSGAANTGCGGSVELMLIYFTSAVKLTTIDFSCYDGYNGSPGNKICVDGDFSVYRADAPPANAGSITSASVSEASATTSTALGTGWTLVGSADMMTQGTNATNPNNGRTDTTKEMSVNNVAAGSGKTNNLYSSWWIISTYFGSSTTNSAGASLNAGNDAFKILSFAATGCAGTVNSSGVCSTGGVPEPATLALVGLALLGVGAARRGMTKARLPATH